jgi:tetratricopeptide (TPR) repeat protein
MTASPRAARIVVVLVAFAATLLVSLSASADDATREAGKHFSRGVALYGEADYRAALVEFKRAYATSPNVAVLYNVGETEYQLQDYAAALTTFERYLTEAGASESHRGEVESTMDILRARVGHLTITTTPPGADITVDDQSAGRTPFERSILVSIGRRKVVATMSGRTPVTRYVEVAADDNASVTIQLAATEGASAALLQQLSSASKADTASSSGSSGTTWRTVGWTMTGLTAVGAITCGILAVKEANDLSAARSSFPTTASVLNRDSNLTLTYSILADSLTAAAVVIGGITLYSTVASSSSSSSSKRGSNGSSRVSLGPGSARFEMTF